MLICGHEEEITNGPGAIHLASYVPQHKATCSTSTIFIPQRTCYAGLDPGLFARTIRRRPGVLDD